MKKILIADGAEENREILKAMFEDKYEVLETADGVQTIQILEENQMDLSLILLNLFVPKMNGLQILEYMKQKGYLKHIPIITITDEAESEQELLAYQYGTAEVLHKPFLTHIVQNRANNIIELYEHRLKIKHELQLCAEQLRKEEKANAEANIKLMLIQIKPHFLHNALANIRYLCDVNPSLAGDALEHLAKYLRENFESLNANGLASMRKEVEHARNYLYIEKLRFGNRLNICWDLEEEDVWLPVLTLQPLIENAVRNGICQIPDGGTVTIKSYKVENGVAIEVIDDGTRQGIREISDDDVALKNVRRRIEELCGGTFECMPQKERGMVVRIIIPK